MTILLYSLSIIPMLLIALVIHELGHLAVAKLSRAKVVGFQIGAGWNIITRYSGRTSIRITPETEMLQPECEDLKPGDVISVYVTRLPGEEGYTAAAISPQWGKQDPPHPEALEIVRRHQGCHMMLTGRIRKIEPESLVLADMAWALKAIPLIAGVIIAEDPGRTMPEAYNMLPWRRQAAITLAGSAANVLLTIAALAVAATFFTAQGSEYAWTIAWVEPGGPAEKAGIRPGDRMVRVRNLVYPTPVELRQQIDNSAEEGSAISIGMLRENATLDFRVKPDPGTWRIGIELELREWPRAERRLNPQAIGMRMTTMAERYTRAVGNIFSERLWNEEDRGERVSGPVMGPYQIGYTVERTGLQGWLVILATLNLGLAATNLVPMPPQDGYRIIAEGAQALRKGKPVNPKVEKAMFVGGITIILAATMYLIATDIMKLLRLG